ncbi:MAG: EAL domain-containing protein [Lachnospiraceae bacterium]|nr:EAL domain-containing protein [Lachnospiraceae bacterium]
MDIVRDEYGELTLDYILYFDYCANFILIILLATTLYRGMTTGRANKVYIEMLILGLLQTSTDIFSIVADRMGPEYIEFKYATNTLYLLFHSMSAPMYLIYLLVLSDTDHKLTLLRKSLFSLPFACSFLVLILNFWNQKVFYFNTEGEYIRGPWFWVLYLSALLYSIFEIYNVFRYRKHYGRDRFFALFGMFPLLISALAIQLVQPYLLMEMFANAIGLLLISMLVQRPEEFIDTETRLAKSSAYGHGMRHTMSNGKPSTVIVMNLMNYSSLREVLGYQGTQDLIRKISDKLIAYNRKSNDEAVLYYLGDGRFRYVLDYRHLDRADEVAGALNKSFKTDVKQQSMELNLVCLTCVIRIPEDIRDPEDLFSFEEDLDMKYYTGEVLYAKDLYQKSRYTIKRNIDSIIENALATHQFEVYYQPIYAVEEQRFNSAEALLRLKDPEHGFISPEIFIPAAEKSGAIHKIGAFVMEEVCKFIASDEYRHLGLDYIEVNLSVTQCMRNNLADEIIHTMKQYDILPDQINLEITETAASFSQNTLMDNINTLTSEGIAFSLDDFGTGYSNMRRIASMPFRIVKLDKTFANEQHNRQLTIVLESTIQMIKAMNMKIVVEGVETAELVTQFSKLECDYIQGFYYSRPIPRDEFVSFIIEHNQRKQARR